MNYFIPQSFIQKILTQTNLVEIIRQHIPLYKSTNNYYALCPFHKEKTPSFLINTQKQYFYCFGCHVHGNAIDFLIKYHHVTFLESIQEIIKYIGITIPNEYIIKHNQEFKEEKIFYKNMKIISELYHNNLKTNNAIIAQKYLKKRKINQVMINYFKIGFSTNTLLILKKNKNHNIYNFIKNNILIQKKNNYQYDRFYNRIIFPIKNQYGCITGFGGRSLIQHQYPKYINSNTTKIFNKSHELYGIDKIKKCNINIKYILVVEGYFDVISLTQYNINNVVATMGTMITKAQIKILFHNTHNIIYCYDGDVSGQEAAWRTLKITLPYIKNNENIKFIFLPHGEDPDSIIHKEGNKKFKTRIKNAINMIDFFFKKLCKKINLYTLEGKNNLINISIPLINTIPNIFIRRSFIKFLGEKIGIIDTIELKKIFYENKKNYTYFYTKPNKIRILISLIIKYPKIVHFISCSIKEIKQIKIHGLSFFMEIFKICKIFHNIHPQQLITLYVKKKNIYNIINKLFNLENMIEFKNINYVFIDLIINIYNTALEKKYNYLINKDRMIGLNIKEKYILYKINKVFKIKKY